jgi:hypothetical protein
MNEEHAWRIPLSLGCADKPVGKTIRHQSKEAATGGRKISTE